MTQIEKRANKQVLLDWIKANRHKYGTKIECLKAGIAATGSPIAASYAQACQYFRVLDGKPSYDQLRSSAKNNYKAAPITEIDIVTAVNSLVAQRAEHSAKIADIDAILDSMKRTLGTL